MPVEKLQDPDGIRDVPGGKITDREALAEAERCATERTDALLKVKGAQLRSELYTPEVVADLAYGTVGLMLADIMTRKIEPKDAKQAIEIARIALQISDRVVGQSQMTYAAPAGGSETPTERAAKVAKASELLAKLRDEAHKVVDAHDAADGAPGVDLDQFDLDDDEDHDSRHLHAVASAS